MLEGSITSVPSIDEVSNNSDSMIFSRVGIPKDLSKVIIYSAIILPFLYNSVI